MSRQGAAVVVTVIALLAPVRSHALFHLSQIDEVMSGAAGNPNVQYVQIRMLAAAQNFVANGRLTFFSCSAGNPVTKLLVVPSDLAAGGAGGRWIMAAPDDATFFAASGIHPDFQFSPGIDNRCGMICWGAPVGSNFRAPADPNSWDATNPNNYVDCWAYGGYGGPTRAGMMETTASPAGDGTLSLTRSATGIGLACPTPTNDAGNRGTSAPCSATTTTTLPSPVSGCSDAGAATAARAMISTQCPCDGATSHRAYVRCAVRAVKQAVSAGTLPKSCKGTIRKCAADSTCGRSGSVACCRTTARGTRKCSVKSRAAACRVPKGGTACVSIQSSCCDACKGEVCTPSTSRPSTTTTTHPKSPPTTMPGY